MCCAPSGLVMLGAVKKKVGCEIYKEKASKQKFSMASASFPASKFCPDFNGL